MRDTVTMGLAAIVATLLLTLPSAASGTTVKHYRPKPHTPCRADYVKRGETVKEHKHGKVVKVKQTWCVYVAPKTSTAAAAVLAVHLDPSFTQSPTNPLAVTYSYSASATIGGSPDSSLPDGVLEFFSDGLLACSENVGGTVDGGTCEVTYGAYGAHTVTTIYDSGTNSATTGTQTEDIEPPPPPPPVISGVPADVTLAATSSTTTSFDFTQPTSSVPVSCDHAATGSVFPIGTTTVTCTASNAGGTTSASFTVDVTAPTTAPTFQGVPSDITVPPDSASGSTVTYAPPTATDVFGDPLTVECSIPSGSLLTIGTVTDTCSTSDQWGNSAQSSFSITVQPVTLTITVAYDTSESGVNGSTLPSLLTLPLQYGGPDTPDYAALVVYPTVSGNVTDDPNPSGTVSVGISPAAWYTVHPSSVIGPCDALATTDDACGIYFDADNDYTVSLSFTSTDPNYASVLNGPSVSVEITGS